MAAALHSSCMMSFRFGTRNLPQIQLKHVGNGKYLPIFHQYHRKKIGVDGACLWVKRRMTHPFAFWRPGFSANWRALLAMHFRTWLRQASDKCYCGLVDQETVKWICRCQDAGTWCYRLACSAVKQSFRVEAELSDSGTKYAFLPDLRVEISEDKLAVVDRAFVVQVF